jgi:D-psicose/D-tagatose/L-ribulose 3-epimerase
MMKIGTHYAYWNNMWAADYIALCHRAKKCGLDVLEVGAGDLVTMSDAQLEELRTTAKDLGLEISANLGPPKDKDICSADPAIHEAGVKFLCDILDQMVKIDCKILIGALYNSWPYDFVDIDKPALWSRAIESLKVVGDEAERLGVTIALEILNRFESCMVNDVEEGIKFVGEIDRPAVKLLLDTFHMNIEEDSIIEAIRKAGPLLGHFHVGEANRRCPGPGGRFDWEEIGKVLKEINYDGYVVMEPFVTMGGQVGKDISIWRDLSHGATESMLDKDAADSVAYLRKVMG